MVSMVIPIAELVISTALVLSVAFLAAAGCFLIAGAVSGPLRIARLPASAEPPLSEQ